MKFLGIIASILSILCLVNGADYCSNCKHHTMCGTSSPGNRCVNYESMAPDAAGIKALLHAHNRLRNKVALGQEKQGNPGGQYPAANMMKMEWDEELAKIAQRHADQCVYGHDCPACHTTIGYRISVGQSIAMQWGPGKPPALNFVEMAENWYLREVGLMDKENVKSYRLGKWIHYAQYVWWNSRLIGCGVSYYSDHGAYTQFLVCNYGISGNVLGAKMYEIGTAGSKCPKGTAATDPVYTGLCVIQTPSTDGKFSTDKTYLGLPPNMYPLPPFCSA